MKYLGSERFTIIVLIAICVVNNLRLQIYTDNTDLVIFWVILLGVVVIGEVIKIGGKLIRKLIKAKRKEKRRAEKRIRKSVKLPSKN